MEIKVRLLNDGVEYTSDSTFVSEEEFRDVQKCMEKAAKGEATFLRLYVNGNEMYFPLSILKTSILTIIKMP